MPWPSCVEDRQLLPSIGTGNGVGAVAAVVVAAVDCDDAFAQFDM